MIARIAKRKMDDLEFYGGQLHVCYAPEYESVEETRQKLKERRISIARRRSNLGERSLRYLHSVHWTVIGNGQPQSPTKIGLWAARLMAFFAHV